MKKIFFISCIAVSALAVTTSANTNKQLHLSNQYALNDTVPNQSTDTSQNQNWNNNNNQSNTQDTSMNQNQNQNQSTDTARTAPPQQ